MEVRTVLKREFRLTKPFWDGAPLEMDCKWKLEDRVNLNNFWWIKGAYIYSFQAGNLQVMHKSWYIHSVDCGHLFMLWKRQQWSSLGRKDAVCAALRLGQRSHWLDLSWWSESQCLEVLWFLDSFSLLVDWAQPKEQCWEMLEKGMLTLRVREAGAQMLPEVGN